MLPVKNFHVVLLYLLILYILTYFAVNKCKDMNEYVCG